jgi:hypothetical protein
MSQSKSIEKWDEVILETRDMLARVEAKALRLRTALKTLEESRDAGEQWPLAKAVQLSATQN